MKLSSALLAITSVVSVSLVSADGNRYDKDRYYHSEISAAEAYIGMKHKESVLIDVRRLREYAAGHPKHAYNVPYPHIIDSNDQDASTLYWQVYDIVEGEMDTPITILCRTGSRSVTAGNILSNPELDDSTAGLEPFTNVRNIWAGFVGQYKYAYAGGTVLLDKDGNPYSLDLNNNGVMDEDMADVYDHTADANPDKDGWRNLQQLPWTTQVDKNYAYLQDCKQYKEFQE